jgi:uncharacterized protein YyaL (SSP411 family)
MYHYYDGSRHILGLLTDQIYVARALVHAIQYTGETDYLPVLTTWLVSLVRKQSATHGGFYDISEEHVSFSLLRRRNKSILENALMAEVLIRAYYLSLDESRLTLARRTLEAFAQDYQLFGYLSASYARAVDLFFHKPIHVVIVGAPNDPMRAEIARAGGGHLRAFEDAARGGSRARRGAARAPVLPRDRAGHRLCLPGARVQRGDPRPCLAVAGDGKGREGPRPQVIGARAPLLRRRSRG